VCLDETLQQSSGHGSLGRRGVGAVGTRDGRHRLFTLDRADQRRRLPVAKFPGQCRPIQHLPAPRTQYQTLGAPAKARTLEDAQALHRHRLDRYYVIDTRLLTPAQAQALAAQLKQDPAIEDVDFEPLVDGMHNDKADPVEESARSGIPDYTERQNYLFGRSAVAPYKIGGVNAVQAWKVPGGKGENMRVISSEIDHWSYDHADLPKPFLEVDAGAVTGYHDTASVGTIASRKMPSAPPASPLRHNWAIPSSARTA
jgi:hypothetical protein